MGNHTAVIFAATYYISGIRKGAEVPISDKHILIVDDDPKIRSLLRNCLEGEGARIEEACSASEARAHVAKISFDLITLDIALGDDDGFDMAREIRRVSQVPIIMLTGKDDVIDRVVGLEIGADDYITKPFHVRELIARVKSVLRRAHTGSVCQCCGETPCICDEQDEDLGSVAYEFEGMTAVPDRFNLWDKHGIRVELTSGEFKLLRVFLERPNRILSRDQLMDFIGGHDWSPLDRTIDNQVARLRKKIEDDPSNPKIIKTVRGVGYSMSVDVTQTPGQSASVKT